MYQEREIHPFSVQIEGWGLPIHINAYDQHDAEGLTRIAFEIPSSVAITATPKKSTEPFTMGIRGRKRLNIPLKSISDTLKQAKDIGAAAATLGCSRGYIYQKLKLAGTNPREVMK